MNRSIKQKWHSTIKPIAKCIKHCNDIEYLKWYFFHSKKLQKFRNVHKGEGCFIIGNGPSISQMDLSHLRNCYTFGLNKIFLLFDQIDLNLSYHVAVNPYVIRQSALQIEALPCPSFLSYRPAHKEVHPSKHIYYLMTTGHFAFNKNLEKIIHEGCTVTYVAMQIAYYMGFSKIFLIGVDHNFHYSGEPNEKQVMQGKDLNHFDPRYFQNCEWQLPDLEASELAYQTAHFYFKRNGRRIYDATVNGKLNIFPKISFEQALSMCSL
jgi:hypothetical protein